MDLPIFCNVSGGRTSGYMAHFFKDNPEIKFLFQNTGRERPETYDFVRDLADNFNIDIIWLEYQCKDGERPRVEVVNYETANREGLPFEQLITKRNFIPNKSMRFCTQELKILTAKRYIRSLGIKKWYNFIGFRADEPHRLEKIKDRYEGKTIQEHVKAPLAELGVTIAEVRDFWKKQNFDLNLPMLPNGKTIGGNCMGCFWHSEYQNAQLCKTHPKEVDWLVAQEKRIGATFSKDQSWEDLRVQAKIMDESSFDFEDAYCQEPTGTCGT